MDVMSTVTYTPLYTSQKLLPELIMTNLDILNTLPGFM